MNENKENFQTIAEKYSTRKQRELARDAILKFFGSAMKEMKDAIKSANNHALNNKQYELLGLYGKINNLLNEMDQLEADLSKNFPRTPDDEYCSEEIEKCISNDATFKDIISTIRDKILNIKNIPDAEGVTNLLETIRDKIQRLKEVIQTRLKNFAEIEQKHKDCIKSLERFSDELQRRELDKDLYETAKSFLEKFPDPKYPTIRLLEILGERMNTMLRLLATTPYYDPSLHRFFNLSYLAIKTIDEKRDITTFTENQMEIVKKFEQGKEKITEGLGTLKTLLSREKLRKSEQTSTQVKSSGKNKKGVYLIAFILFILIAAILVIVIKG